MLYETLLQAKIFLSVMYFGIVSGIFYEILHLIKFKNVIASSVQDFIFMLGFTALYIYSVHTYSYGEFRLYTIIAFLVGFLIERKTIGKFVALFLNMFYNICVKFLIKLKQTKFFKFLQAKLKVVLQKTHFVKNIKKWYQKRKISKREPENEGIF